MLNRRNYNGGKANGRKQYEHQLGGIRSSEERERKKKFDIMGMIKKLFSPKNRVWTIAILSVSALLIIGTIFISTYFSPKNVALRWEKAFARNDIVAIQRVMAFDYYEYLLGEQTEEKFFDEQSDYYKEEIDSWESYSIVEQEKREDELFEAHGEHKMSFEAIREKDISKRSLESKLGEQLEIFENETDFHMDRISKAKEITVKVKIEGEERNVRYTRTIYVVKVGLFWKVLYAD